MKLNIERKAWQKICAYVDNCDYEIGGLGQVTCDGDEFTVSDVEIFTQVVTSAHVDMTAETLALFQTEKVRAKQSMKDYKFWWHSHAKMEAFFSGTDTGTIDSSTEFNWLVSFVTNHKHALKARLDIYTPVHVTCELDVNIIDEQDVTIIETCKKEIAEKVTMPKPFNRLDYHKNWYAGDIYPKRNVQQSIQNFMGYKTDIPQTPTERKLDKLEQRLKSLEGHQTKLQKGKLDKQRKRKLEQLEEEIAEVSIQIDAIYNATSIE